MITLHPGDNLAALRRLPTASVDAVVTDPPYGLGAPPEPIEMLRAWLDGNHLNVTGGGFMGRQWDAFVPQPGTWREVFRVMKPGAFLLAFFGTRTLDVGTLAIRLAGFEIRDTIAWVYGGGFPKSLTVLKPAFEPIAVARKPFPGTVVENVLRHGVGALNIDGCRITSDDVPAGRVRHGGGIVGNGTSFELPDGGAPMPAGR